MAWTPEKIHALADKHKIEWDNAPEFMAFCKQWTGESHLDKMTPAQLNTVARAVKIQLVKEAFFEKLAAVFDDPARHADSVNRRSFMNGLNKGVLKDTTGDGVSGFNRRYDRLSAMKKAGRQPVVTSSFSGKTRNWRISRPFPK